MKQRVAWLVVDCDGEPHEFAYTYKPNADNDARHLNEYEALSAPFTVVEAVYDWPQKGKRT